MDDIFIVQGPKNVAKVFHDSNLVVTRAYSLVLQQCFGMQQRAVDAYLADTSGSRRKPIEGSVPGQLDRISLVTHENLVSGLLQDGLGAASQRFENFFQESLHQDTTEYETIVGRHSWRDEPDLDAFFQRHVGCSLIKTLFGHNMLRQDLDFMDKLWEYDSNVMRLAQRMPAFWFPRAYELRDRLLHAVKSWHAKGRAHTKSSDKDEAGLVYWWGTKMMKERHSMLLGATGQDEDSVASTDLAFIWA